MTDLTRKRLNSCQITSPQPSESPEKARTLAKSRFASAPSRTQQKLELQRRETMRTGGGPDYAPFIGHGSKCWFRLCPLHSRSGSRGRNRSIAEEMKAQKVDFETGVKQLTVVRRFRNPIMQSLNRMKASGALHSDLGVAKNGPAKSRPQSRRSMNSAAGHGPNKASVSRSLEDNKSATTASGSRRTSRGVHFQRQGSHDDIGITPSQGSPDGADEDDGISPEEALMRRIWNSRVV